MTATGENDSVVILQAYGNYLYMNHHNEEYDVFVNLQSFHRVCLAFKLLLFSNVCQMF